MHKGVNMYSCVKIKVSNLIHTVEAGVGDGQSEEWTNEVWARPAHCRREKFRATIHPEPELRGWWLGVTQMGLAWLVWCLNVGVAPTLQFYLVLSSQPCLFSARLLSLSVSVAWTRKAFEFDGLGAEFKVGCELQTNGMATSIYSVRAEIFAEENHIKRQLWEIWEMPSFWSEAW